MVQGLAGRRRKAKEGPPDVDHLRDRDREGRGGAGSGLCKFLGMALLMFLPACHAGANYQIYIYIIYIYI